MLLATPSALKGGALLSSTEVTLQIPLMAKLILLSFAEN